MEALVERYRLNYGLASEEPLTEEQVRSHFELERRLADDLHASTPASRRQTFERCYSELYRELPWLNTANLVADVGDWPALIGPSPKRVYEIGSGQGGLARALADCGYDVEATEITLERGRRRGEYPGVRWSETDGVYVDRFAVSPPYDAVVSNQVVEHLHPDDLLDHFRGVYSILRPGGRYAFTTPHVFTGPSDISRVFLLDHVVGMHLREYSHRELKPKLLQAGFSSVAAPFALPKKIRSTLGLPLRLSANYLRYLIGVESLLERLSTNSRASIVAHLVRPVFAKDIALVANR